MFSDDRTSTREPMCKVSNLAAACVVVCGLSCTPLAGAQTQLLKSQDIRIAAQPVGLALKELARQTGLQVVVLSADVTGKQAKSVNGTLTGEQALAQMLRDTGLVYRKVDERTIAVVDPTSTVQGKSTSS